MQGNKSLLYKASCPEPLFAEAAYRAAIRSIEAELKSKQPTLLVNAFNKEEGAREDGVQRIHEGKKKIAVARASGCRLPPDAIGIWLLQSPGTASNA